MSVNTEHVITAGLYREDLCELGGMSVYKDLLTAEGATTSNQGCRSKSCRDGEQWWRTEPGLQDRH